MTDVNRVPAPDHGEEYVMECTMTVEAESKIVDWETLQHTKEPAQRKVLRFEGYATKEVVDAFMGIAYGIAQVPLPYLAAPPEWTAVEKDD